MKHTTYFSLFFSLFALHACSLNTKFDDDKYRPVGASTPVNSKTHTVSDTNKVHFTQKADNESESNSTRYVHPNSQASFNSKVANKTIVTTTTPQNNKNTTTVNQGNTNPPSTTSNTIIESINDVFSSRYGNTDIIMKISKTVQIHCVENANKPPNQFLMKVCEYQFPKYCGAHRFSVINSQNKQLLMFHDISYQRNIIDTLTSKTGSTPGLWDQDDYVSSELLTVKQIISNKTSDTNELGWIMSVSENERSQLGRSYLSATREASKCF